MEMVVIIVLLTLSLGWFVVGVITIGLGMLFYTVSKPMIKTYTEKLEGLERRGA